MIIIKGRMEHKLKSEEYMKKVLVDRPQFIKDFYDDLLVRKEYLTAQRYVERVNKFMDFLVVSGKSINENDFTELNVVNVNRYILSMHGRTGNEASDSSKVLMVSALKAFCDYLVRVDKITNNPLKKFSQPNKDAPKQVYLTGEELKVLINNIAENSVGSSIARSRRRPWIERNLAIFRILITTGIRVTALVELNIEDYNPVTHEIEVIDKRRNTFVKVLDDNTAKTLDEWILKREIILNGIECDALFISNRKTRITSKSVRDLVYSYCEDMEKHISPHKLRSSFATNFYLETKDMVQVQKLLGHKRMDTTQRYTAGIETDSLKAANYMDNLLK